MTRVLVTGSRDWSDWELVFQTLDDVVERFTLDALRHPPVPFDQASIVVVHGACPTGADRYAENWAILRGYKVEYHPADWDKYGDPAGPIRNSNMVALGARICVAFRLPTKRKRPGTKDCYEKAIRAGIVTLVVPGRRE